MAPDLERQAAADRHPDGGAGGAGGHLLLQDQLARRPLLHDRLRLAFLLFALFWIGWYGQAQLSVVNVLTFFSALRSDFRWDYFLMDPLVFILWCATAVSMVFWNRGAFCGWLCPFGALQELLNRAAKRLGVKQLQVPHGVNQRLSALKYIIFVLLFGYALYDLALAERLAEVEPFKTAIILRFARAWPFVLFAALLLAAGLFIERFYCRYLCPLGWRDSRAPAHLQLAQALSRLRQSLPALQPRMPGAGHRAQRRNQSQRVHPVPALPDALPPRRKCPHLLQRKARRERRRAPPAEAAPRSRDAPLSQSRRRRPASSRSLSPTVPIHDAHAPSFTWSHPCLKAMLPSPVSAAAVSWGPPPSPAPPAGGGSHLPVAHGRTPSRRRQTSHIGPGELDEYYAFNSSGQSGEIRVLGLPSMRELVRIPVFNHCSATGWGRTNESRKILTEGLTPETRAYLRDKGGVFINGDAHHPHLSFTDRTYDGRYLYVNDKANNRVAHPPDVMKTDKIVELPNVSGVHGLRQRYPRTGYVFANGEHHPLPNDGKVTDDPKKNFFAVYTAIDGDTMKIAAGAGGRQPGQRRRRLPGQVFLLHLLQLREGRIGGGSLGQRAGLGRGVQHQAHRAGHQGRRLQDHGRRAGGGRTPRLEVHALHPVPNSPHGCNAAPDGIHRCSTASSRPR